MDKTTKNSQKSKKHNLKTIEDIVKVINENNIGNFIKDFATFLTFRMKMKEIAKMTKSKVEMPPTFNWIDDGKNDVNLTINIVENEKKNKKV